MSKQKWLEAYWEAKAELLEDYGVESERELPDSDQEELERHAG